MPAPGPVQIETFQIGTMRNFVYVLSANGQACLIDPHRGLDPVAHFLKRESLQLTHVLLTHSHHDHVAGLEESYERFGHKSLTLALHADEQHRISTRISKHPWKIQHLKEGDRIPVGDQFIQTLHTPGHSAGELCFLTGNHLFTGDTLFMGNVGRTDLPTGDTAQLFESLMRICKLPDETILHPGHDYGETPTNTLKAERQTNPGLLVKSVAELDALP